MNRTLAGVLLLLLLLAASIASAIVLDRGSQEIAGLLEEASGQAMAGDLEAARDTAAQARLLWEQDRKLTAALTDHGPLEQVECSFARLHLYGSCDRIAFGVLCAELAKQVEAIADVQRLRWENLL